ncbi:MAG: hypothetical protein MdMp014T_2868 [Treponematales bacterium]
MSLFCVLWTPLFYLFWRSVNRGYASGGLLAFTLGSAAAIVRLFLGPLVEAGEFGFLRWQNACVDIVALPVILPFLACFLLTLLRVFPSPPDFTAFVLLWLVPNAAVHGVTWSAEGGPLFLALVPLLWTAVSVGIPFFVRLLPTAPKWAEVLFILCALALPFLSATVWWAFYTRRLFLGVPLLVLSGVPLVIPTVRAFLRYGE